MPTTSEEVVTALRDALNVTAKVDLELVNATPYAVVAGPSGVATWVDLRASLAAYPDRDARFVAAAVMSSERWEPLALDTLLSELCKDLGFCDAAYEKQKLTNDGPYSVDAFVDAVIELEGLDPLTTEWRGHVREIVAKHFRSRPE